MGNWGKKNKHFSGKTFYMRTLYVGQFNIIPTRVLAHLKTSNVVRGRILHRGTPYLGIKLPFLHPPHKQRGIYTYPNH